MCVYVCTCLCVHVCACRVCVCVCALLSAEITVKEDELTSTVCQSLLCLGQYDAALSCLIYLCLGFK